MWVSIPGKKKQSQKVKLNLLTYCCWATGAQVLMNYAHIEKWVRVVRSF